MASTLTPQPAPVQTPELGTPSAQSLINSDVSIWEELFPDTPSSTTEWVNELFNPSPVTDTSPGDVISSIINGLPPALGAPPYIPLIPNPIFGMGEPIGLAVDQVGLLVYLIIIIKVYII